MLYPTPPTHNNLTVRKHSLVSSGCVTLPPLQHQSAYIAPVKTLVAASVATRNLVGRAWALGREAGAIPSEQVEIGML